MSSGTIKRRPVEIQEELSGQHVLTLGNHTPLMTQRMGYSSEKSWERRARKHLQIYFRLGFCCPSEKYLFGYNFGSTPCGILHPSHLQCLLINQEVELKSIFFSSTYVKLFYQGKTKEKCKL